MHNPSKLCIFLFRILCCLILAGTIVLSPFKHSVFAQATRIIFLHHSVGYNLIEVGGVRQGLASLGYEFYDHGYNGDGLRLVDGTYTGLHFAVPDDNTDPDGLAAIFAQPLHSPPDNTFSYLMQYDVIIFKSCYPTSYIESDSQLAAYQSHYLSIRDRMDEFPDKLFVIVTPPPEVPGESDLEAATRARIFVNWLQSDEYLSEHPNVFVFDFFDLLAGEDNFLRQEYRYDDYDGHPNERANRAIGPIFVDFIDQTIRSFEGGETRPTPITVATPDAVVQPEPSEPGSEAFHEPSPAGLLDDFETMEETWDGDSDDTGSILNCSVVLDKVHSGQRSMRIQYQIAAGGWGGCWRTFEDPKDWSKGSGLSLWLYSEKPAQWVNLDVILGDANDVTPFIATIVILSSGWEQVFVPWADFERASWASETGPQTFELTQVVGYGLGFGSEEHQLENTLWIDDISLSTEGEGPSSEEQPMDEEAQIEPTSKAAMPEESAAEEPEDSSARSLCPFSSAVLPLAAVFLLIKRRRHAR